MELDQIRSFREVARLGSFSRAAEKMLRTQPAISNQIKLLEQELGERLFDRIGKKVYLTKAGEMLLGYAEKLCGLIDEAKLAMAELRAEPRGILSIGANEATCMYILPELFRVFRQRYPQVQISIYRNFTSKVIEKILGNQLDLGVVTLPVKDDNLVVIPIYSDQLCLIVDPKHLFASRRSVRLAELSGHPFIFPKAGGTRMILERLFRRRRHEINISMEIASVEIIKKFVSIGLGIAILPQTYVQAEVKEGLLRALRLADVKLMRRLGLVYRRDKYISRAARAFLEVTREMMPAARAARAADEAGK